MREHLVEFFKDYIERTEDTERIENLLEKEYLTQEEYDEIIVSYNE